MEKRRDGQPLTKEGEVAGSWVSVWEMVRSGERGGEGVSMCVRGRAHQQNYPGVWQSQA